MRAVRQNDNKTNGLVRKFTNTRNTVLVACGALLLSAPLSAAWIYEGLDGKNNKAQDIFQKFVKFINETQGQVVPVGLALAGLAAAAALIKLMFSGRGQGTDRLFYVAGAVAGLAVIAQVIA